MTEQALMCPILTQVQVVPRGLRGEIKVQMTPVGMARAQTTQGILGGKGGLDLGREVMVYEASGSFGGVFGLKTPAGTKPGDPDPQLVADTLVVPCQGAACMFWGVDVQDCRLVAGSPAVALASAKSKAHEDYESNMGNGPKEESVS